MLPRAAKVYLSVVAAALAAGLVVLVTAAATGTDLAVLAAGTPQPGNSSTKAQANCDRFIGHVASNLGKSPDQVKKAMTDALNQSLDDAVKAGDLTQQQADAIKARESGKQVCSGLLRGVGAHEHGPGKAARVGLAEYAKALGISEQDLRQQLAAGKTVKDIAASQNLSESDFRTKLTDVVRADLDAQVKSGKLTQQQEDNVLNKLENDPLPLWDKPVKKPATPPGQRTS
jgi:hypothetical protein